ncbi:MAG: TonB-dependent receptor domain-containing protein [Emticicia sp.]|uniref:TonB-dependent receptor domain-containing protein n=1 Tax=Emticicia sp. TaxID=1930953 RepID=UPI003BA5B015
MQKPLFNQAFLLKMMKISLTQCFLAFVLVLQSLAHNGKAQDLLEKKVSVNLQNVNMQDAISEIGKVADAKFFYSSKVILSDKKISLQVQNQRFSEVLSQVFSPLHISYKVYGNQIVLNSVIEETKTQDHDNVMPAMPIADPISGKVISVKGETLPGVSIVVKGTKRGTSTEVDGSYKINASKGEVLQFSFVGYQNQEITVGDNNEINVTLVEAASQLSEVVVIGSRGQPRTDVERAVPVDVLSAKELQATGQVELGQMVQFNSPSFNSAKTGINGVANYADPATLRGLSPDQVLVLVDGKRRHQFSALNLNVTVGLGTVVTDMNSIPSLALDRVEVLRDGAAAQYGSDAIAGIVNLGLNKSVGKGTFKTQYGITKMGDGGTYMGALNYGFKLGKEKSYLNMTLHYQHANGTDRSDFYNPRPVAGGTYTGIYSSTQATDEATRKTRGVWGEYGTFKVTKYGSNQNTAYQGFYNLGYPINDKWNLYSFGGVSAKDVLAYGFFRVANPSNANSTPEIFPDGFTPELPGKTIDYSSVVGLNRKVIDGWNLDFSAGYGYNYLDLWANNTVNPSMGASSPTDFYVGRSAVGQTTLETNISKNFKGLLGTKNTNIAFGSQFRAEQFLLKQGSPESHQVGPLATSKNKAPGSSGRPGIAPADETDATRNNIGVYADVESDITNKFLIAAALRYENYSDFGSNVSGKLAARLKLSENISIRGSINKGFRAPSLQQTYNSVTTSTVQAGAIIQTKQLPNSDPRLAQLGIEKPKAENSLNYNLGITAKAGDKFLFTLDAYQIDITDRIILSERMIVNSIAALKPLFPGISEIRFFTNHINTRTRGIDFVTTFNHKFNSKSKLTASLALTFNETKLTSQKPTPSLLQAGTSTKILMIDTVSISLIETAQPRQKILASVGYQINKFNANVRASYFGPVTAWEKPVGRPHITQTFGGKTLIDVALTYAFSPKLSITLGSNNITDVYPDRVLANFAGYTNGQIPFTRNANQFGFNGAFYYVNATINF